MIEPGKAWNIEDLQEEKKDMKAKCDVFIYPEELKFFIQGNLEIDENIIFIGNTGESYIPCPECKKRILKEKDFKLGSSIVHGLICPDKECSNSNKINEDYI